MTIADIATGEEVWEVDDEFKDGDAVTIIERHVGKCSLRSCEGLELESLRGLTMEF